MDKFCKLFNVGPKAVMYFSDTDGAIHDQTYYGKPVSFDLSLALVNYAGIQFEFIQPLRGDDNPYSDYLKSNPNGGIHHINVAWRDFGGACKALRDAGATELTTGELMGGEFIYLELLEQMGLVFESSANIPDDYGIGDLMP